MGKRFRHRTVTFGLLQRLLDVLAQASRTIAAAVLLVGLSLAQQEPIPAFRAHTDLVVVPFQVRHGSRPVSDLKPADVVLLEDGAPRAFTVFEPPSEHPSLELVVMFDVTSPEGGTGFWDAKSLRELAHYWSEAVTRRLIDEPGATVRFSVYRFDGLQLQRLCRSTGDPAVLRDALNRLAGPVPANQASTQDVAIPLPAGLVIRDAARKSQASGRPRQPWSLAGALYALRDSATAPILHQEKPDHVMAARALVIFSTGAEGTALTPQDLAEEAIAAGVPVYPVALLAVPFITLLPYDGYGNGFRGFTPNSDGNEAPRQSIYGPAGAHAICSPNGPHTPECPIGWSAPYINYPFELLGDLTGGLRFESVNHAVVRDADIQGCVMAAANNAPMPCSMTGGEAADILERVKRHAMARFRSNYTVGFVPSPSGSPREHTLEVRLASKSSSKVTDGKRTATY